MYNTDSIVDNLKAGSTSMLTVGANDATSTFAGLIKNSGAGATLALTKIGTGTLTLSGANTYTGATMVSSGVLALTSRNDVLSTNTAVSVASGATLALNFTGTNTVRSLALDGAPVAVGTYGQANGRGCLTGTGFLRTTEDNCPKGTVVLLK